MKTVYLLRNGGLLLKFGGCRAAPGQRVLGKRKLCNLKQLLGLRIWYRPDITTAMRVQYGNRILDIETMIDPEERHVELHLLCKEVVPGG